MAHSITLQLKIKAVQKFSFAKLQGLDQAQTLSLFAEHYASVLATPEGTDHQNIRQFMQNGWDGVKFEGQALTEK